MWQITGGSWRGTSHVRTGLKNQDAIKYALAGAGEAAVLAIADGHGSDLCFRSDIGSTLAVETAVEIMQRFAKSGRPITERMRVAIAEELTQTWRIAVRRDIDTRAFTAAELSGVVALEGWSGQKALKRHPELAYGSTVLAVLATREYVLCLQLGDGDILFIDYHGHVYRPMHRNEPAEEKPTPSLWRPDAAAETHFFIQEDAKNLPAMIVAATDGYAKAHISDSALLEAGRNYLKIVRSEGFEGIGIRLDHTSSWEGGDDVTVGFICRADVREKSYCAEPRKMAAVLRNLLGLAATVRDI